MPVWSEDYLAIPTKVIITEHTEAKLERKGLYKIDLKILHNPDFTMFLQLQRCLRGYFLSLFLIKSWTFTLCALYRLKVVLEKAKQGVL